MILFKKTYANILNSAKLTANGSQVGVTPRPLWGGVAPTWCYTLGAWTPCSNLTFVTLTDG